ncbi:probable crossover junction endonuclease EME2 isoform X2 [Perognathus longimembris pacificus]|uniref:probable crossover junction endonuclease EME2 isoform X2 n=1 Tax=Perognathus longimembris pacificus TaxID=214514 RepID=UPI00201966F3|nr:probable crossover junction endonuclease EME2 isoform X2 [Perognathus longimembris pacificus]
MADTHALAYRSQAYLPPCPGFPLRTPAAPTWLSSAWMPTSGINDPNPTGPAGKTGLLLGAAQPSPPPCIRHNTGSHGSPPKGCVPKLGRRRGFSTVSSHPTTQALGVGSKGDVGIWKITFAQVSTSQCPTAAGESISGPAGGSHWLARGGRDMDVLLVASWQELSQHVCALTKALAQRPSKQYRDTQAFAFCTAGRWASGQRVTRDGSGLQGVWWRQIRQFNRVSPAVAEAIVTAFPSPRLLQEALTACSSEQERLGLLADLPVNAQGGRPRRVGPDLSRRICLFLSTTNPDLLLDLGS